MAKAGLCSMQCDKLVRELHGMSAGSGSAPSVALSRVHAVARRKSTLVPRATPPEIEQRQVDRFNVSQQTPDIDQLTADGQMSPETDAATKKLVETVQGMPVQQQQELANLYLYLVQHPESSLKFAGFSAIQKAFDQYQVLIWRPAELLNGRMAMIGFVAGLGCEYLTGASIWTQAGVAPFAYLTAYLLIVAASALNKQFGSPSNGIGPFTRRAELFNSRAAMVGFAILGYAEYNVDIRKAALLWAQNVQHLQLPGTST